MLNWLDIQKLHDAIYTKDAPEVRQLLKSIDDEVEISSRLDSDSDKGWYELDLLANCLVIGHIRQGQFDRATRVPAYLFDKPVLPAYERWRLRLARKLLSVLEGGLSAMDV